MPTRTDGARCRLIISGAVITLVPEGNESKDALDTFFAAHGSKVTVAFTQADAVMGGYGDTSQPYKSLVVTAS